MKTNGLRIAYDAGPGDIWGVYRALSRGEADFSTSHVSYAELMIRACRSLLGAQALLALTTNPGGEDEDFRFAGLSVRVLRIQDHLKGKRNLAYHAASLYSAVELRRVLKMFAPDVLVLGDHPSLLLAALMRPRGCSIVRAYHCVLWPQEGRKLSNRVLTFLDSLLVGSLVGSFSVLRHITDQVQAAFDSRAPICEYLPHYDLTKHKHLTPLPPLDRDLRVAFVGRVEIDKGVLDLVQIADLVEPALEGLFRSIFVATAALWQSLSEW